MCLRLLGMLYLLICSVILSTELVGQSTKPKVKNIIFFIGDGMGVATITGGRIWAHGSKGKLNFERFPYTGYAKTYSSTDYVTDSAAAATALASGVKTFNGSIGFSDPQIDPSGKARKLQTLLDLSIKQGKSFGIVTTTSVTHATPASFYSHSLSRDFEHKISKQVIDSQLKILLGGGRKIFNKTKNGEKSTLTNLIDNGWKYFGTRKQMLESTIHENDRIIGLFAEDHLSYDLDRSNIIEEPSLLEMVRVAQNHLAKNPNGYFLLVEGGRIDHAAHDNDPKYMFGDLIALDRTVGHILDQDLSETLVVVTADHETGGVALSGYGPVNQIKDDIFLGKEINFLDQDSRYFVTFASGPGGLDHHKKGDVLNQHPAVYKLSTAAHTAVDVPIFAAGWGAENFTGFMNNIDIPRKISDLMGEPFSSEANEENYSKSIE